MKKRATVLDSRPAGADHAVTTVTGGDRHFRIRPCADCPWRRDAVGKFPPDAFRLSANTGAEHLSIPSVCETELNERFNTVSHTFGCHSSGVERPVTCAGYILRGKDSLSWRIAMAHGKFDPTRVSAGGAKLFRSYYEMAVANGVPADDPALAACRPWKAGSARTRKGDLQSDA